MSEKILVTATLLVAGIPDSTIRFFLSVYEYMAENKDGFNCSDLSKQSDYTSESARQHVTVLTEYEFLNRTGYRSWLLETSKFRSLGELKTNGKEAL